MKAEGLVPKGLPLDRLGRACVTDERGGKAWSGACKLKVRGSLSRHGARKSSFSFFKAGRLVQGLRQFSTIALDFTPHLQ